MPIRFDDPQPIDRAAVRTVEEQLGFDVPAEHRRTAGQNGPPDLGRATRQFTAGEIGRTEGGQHLGQAGRGHGP